VDGRNLFKLPVLLDLAAEARLDVKQAEDVVVNRRFKDAVDKDWSDARQSMITAVPSFLMGGDRLVGAQPYLMLENFVTMHGAQLQKRDS